MYLSINGPGFVLAKAHDHLWYAISDSQDMLAIVKICYVE